MAKLMKYMGWLSIVSGIIVGIVVANKVDQVLSLVSYSSEKSFHLSVAITWWVSGAVSGILFIAIGIILEHSQEILYNQQVILRKFSTTNEPSSSSLPSTKMKLSSSEGYRMKSFE